MKLAAAKAIAARVSKDELSAEQIVPSVFDHGVAGAVARAVAQAAGTYGRRQTKHEGVVCGDRGRRADSHRRARQSTREPYRPAAAFSAANARAKSGAW